MAIFYKHIKGCGDNQSLWSWIKWSDSTTTLSKDEISQDHLPEIALFNENTIDANKTLYSAGKIITSNARNQELNKFFCFNDSVYIKGVKLIGKETGTDNIYYDGTNKKLMVSTDTKTKINFNASGFTFTTGDVTVEPNLTVQGNTTLRSHLHVGNATDYSFPTNEGENGTIKADYKCEALFFNAVSDRRAKSNISPATFSALSVVQQLPIYTFNYNTNSALVIGLIAQEAAYHNLDGFNMVDNLLASGENGDFMQMKESKLVYVLWKAVQELSEEVDLLKEQIASLK